MKQHRQHPNRNNRHQLFNSTTSNSITRQPLRPHPSSVRGGGGGNTAYSWNLTNWDWPVGPSSRQVGPRTFRRLQNLQSYRVNTLPIKVTIITANASNSVFSHTALTHRQQVRIHVLFLKLETPASCVASGSEYASLASASSKLLNG
jgi:hypothetical protein